MRKLIFVLLACVMLVPLSSVAGGYEEIRIVAPEPEATIHSNNDMVTVEVSVTPALAANDQIALLLDDKVVAKGRKSHYRLTEVYRGSHTLLAQVIGANGSVLTTSQPVVFNMKHASRLFKRPEEKK